MHELNEVEVWMHTTATGKALHSALYAAIVVLINSLVLSAQHDPNLFGIYAPMMVPVLIFLRNLFDKSVPNI